MSISTITAIVSVLGAIVSAAYAYDARKYNRRTIKLLHRLESDHTTIRDTSCDRPSIAAGLILQARKEGDELQRALRCYL